MKSGLLPPWLLDSLSAITAVIVGTRPRPAPVLVPIEIRRTAPVRIPVRRPISS